MLESIPSSCFSTNQVIHIVIPINFLPINSAGLYMLHHLHLRFVHLFMKTCYSVPPCDHKFGHFEGVCFRPELLKFRSGCLSEYLVPWLTILICPCEAFSHDKGFAVESEHVAVGHWLMRALKRLHRLFEEA